MRARWDGRSGCAYCGGSGVKRLGRDRWGDDQDERCGCVASESIADEQDSGRRESGPAAESPDASGGAL